LSSRRLVIDDLIAQHRGRIANTAGDSVLAEFASVIDAVTCAVEIQKAMAEANEAAANLQMRLRIGVNAGDIMVKQGDIFGDGVNVAARLEGLVRGGEICVSRGIRDYLRHRRGWVFEDLGEQLVKNIAHPIRAFRLRVGEAAVEQASLEEDPDPFEPPSAPSMHPDLSPDSAVALELAFWDSVKDGSPAELESYLQQYPDGTFAALARTRAELARHSPSHPATPTPEEVAAEALDLAFWDSVKDSNRPEELQAYLKQHPNGHFAGLARTRLASFDAR
jgi:hypothetical protein